MSEHNIVSVSGGKDSTALLLLAIERGAENLQAVFADTGHEHPQTYRYIEYLNDKVFPIRVIKADFTADILRKREFIKTHWKTSLMKDKPEEPGEWLYVGEPAPDEDDLAFAAWSPPQEPPVPADPYRAQKSSVWEWRPAKPMIKGLTAEQAEEKIARALAILQPTGNPFLDLCIWKGRFPSTKARFCSDELKRAPILEQVHYPLIEAGDDVVSWQGVRADESINRRHLPERECKMTYPNGAELWNYRPILQWTAEDAFAMHKKHGIEPNPLYKQGMGRVGCMPCIHCRKDELLEISRRFPEEIARVAEWEKIVGEASKHDRATFFAVASVSGPAQTSDGSEVTLEKHGVWSVVEWAKTGRGGRQYDIFRVDGEEEGVALCSSIYGLCE